MSTDVYIKNLIEVRPIPDFIPCNGKTKELTMSDKGKVRLLTECRAGHIS